MMREIVKNLHFPSTLKDGLVISFGSVTDFQMKSSSLLNKHADDCHQIGSQGDLIAQHFHSSSV